MDTGIRDQVGLELGDVDVERTVEAERRGQRRDDLADEAVEVRVRRRHRSEGGESAGVELAGRPRVAADCDFAITEQGVEAIDDGGVERRNKCWMDWMDLYIRRRI